ncbi:hypothetical protein [Tychonema sp. BBK16]|uniref:hypothetical protein n=1 Tax=Tychonema sp. BBK16 TaxID=2699888 RepID=UPI001F17F6BB|nr:hypothetical protein [Tychonema sp. BBK16]MCF6375524.1 hypothetical protein [Tychonema sp. BBK16]
MLYLAQVQNQEFFGEPILQLLACQNADDTWAVLAEPSVLTLSRDCVQNLNDSVVNSLNEGVLVLIDIGKNDEVFNMREAKNWVLELLEKYLTTPITLDFLQEEAEKAEKWRQSLTLQSQELSRRLIEVEARRAQIQTLETKIQKIELESVE